MSWASSVPGLMAFGLGTVPVAVLGSLCALGVVAVWM